MGSNVTVVWTAGYTALVDATVSIAPDAQVQSATAGLEATLNLYTNANYDTNRLGLDYTAITDGEFLYYGVSVPNAPIHGDLRVDMIQICDKRVLATSGIVCIQLLNVEQKVVDNQKPSLTTTGIAIVGFPFPATNTWTVFVSGLIIDATAAKDSSPVTFAPTTGVFTNQGRRRLLQVDSSFTATADVTLNVSPATSSELTVSMGSREALPASALALLVFTSLFL